MDSDGHPLLVDQHVRVTVRRLTTRLIGPGILRLCQEMIYMRKREKASEGISPAAQLAAIRSQ